ncbi:EthD domain-containing protein [Novosphingobium sp. Chol11]|uniref:EthD domain-containing protein n=1 Tax=Novosphingobium sp. Chol11 TaxID=1385763 RepID=UPI0025ED615A|nr:EthD domain-containing protein [Novosphingobium sp. Chol11]
MIKLTFCLHRLPHLSRAEFHDYWFNTHAPLVASVREALKIRRYIQLHSLPDTEGAPFAAARGAPEPYDGVAQLWWDTAEDLATNTPEAIRAGALLLEDERKFIDLPRSPLWLGEEREVF